MKFFQIYLEYESYLNYKLNKRFFIIDLNKIESQHQKSMKFFQFYLEFKVI